LAVVEFSKLNAFYREFLGQAGCWDVDVFPTVVLEGNSACGNLGKENAYIEKKPGSVAWLPFSPPQGL